MSKQYSRSQSDPLALIRIDEQLLGDVATDARLNLRKRSMLRFHELDEPLQRMLNAIEPESYLRPHRHTKTYKPEVLVALRGSILFVRFSEDGAPVEGVMVSEDGPVKGLEVPQTAWHCFMALQSGTVLLEISQGPYDPATAKDFAPWSPPEEDTEAGLVFIAEMRRHFEPILPQVSAIDQIEAEDDDIC